MATVIAGDSLYPYKWKKINDTVPNGSTFTKPKPRHGHRAVQIKELIIVFGGGNEGIVDELHVFNTNQNTWFIPTCKGDTPPGCAAFGFVVENTRLLVFGGMLEYGRYSGDLFELQATKWEWKKLKPKPPKTGIPPCPRLGHSFTLVNKRVYLFGGLCNASAESKTQTARYLNDLYVLDISKNPHQWEIPETHGTPPSPRESHTMVLWRKNEGTPEQKDILVLYGGMMGNRLGDLWTLDLETMIWAKPPVSGIPPSPRSLHSAVIGQNKMFVFGGWVPRQNEKSNNDQDGHLSMMQKEWKCTNSLGVFDLENTRWESYTFDDSKVPSPKARAGHCATMVHNRMYIWSGRDGYRKERGDTVQVCCSDMWYLETTKPTVPGKVQLLRASTNSLDVHWSAASSAECYHLQIQVYESPPSSTPTQSQPAAVPTSVAAPKPPTAPILLTPTSTAPPTKPAVSVPQAKNLPSGAQFVTLMKPGASHGITLTPGSAVPVTGMVKLVPQSSGGTSVGKPATIMLTTTQPLKSGPTKPVMMIPTAPGINNSQKVETPPAEMAEDKKEPIAESASEPPTPAKAPTPPVPATEGTKTEIATKERSREDAPVKLWYTVGIVNDLMSNVIYYFVPSNDDVQQDITMTERGWACSTKGMVKHPLLPGTAYKFRVAGMNLCGRGPWSEMSAFKTCLPGFPGAPSNIKITKCAEGALLTWEPPANHGDTVTEYAVYLATKPHNAKPDVPIPTSQLSFVKVYDNPTPTCVITHDNLRYAYYDCSGQKPAIIFRIAAKNDKGYGPATQVRWLQDTTPQQR